MQTRASEAGDASQNGLLTTVAWRIGGQAQYALEGSGLRRRGGRAVAPRRDGASSARRRSPRPYALSVPDTAGVYLVPAFTGLGAPYWDMYGRGTLVGLTRGAGRAHIVRAALEAIAFQTADVMEAMARDSATPFPRCGPTAAPARTSS